MTINAETLSRKAWTLLEGKKGQDLRLLDVRGISTVTDFFLMVTGANLIHLKSLADETESGLVKEGIRCLHRSGTHDSGWIVIDYVDVVVHIFSSEARQYYDLERLWSDGIEVAPNPELA